MEPAVLSRAMGKPDATLKDRRLRAVHRRELQNSVRFSALIVSGGVAVSAVGGLFEAPAAAPYIIAIMAPLSLIAFAVAAIVRQRGRHYAVPLAVLIGLLPCISVSLSIVIVPKNEMTAIGALGLITVAFAVFLPLERKAHLIWLVMANLVFLGLVVQMLASNADRTGPSTIVVICCLATSLSMGAKALQLSRRRQMNSQILAVRGLYGRMKEHELDLRRQDEFLFMQQETLVVQQAELLRLNEELETIARMDTLTGLGNRLRLNEDLASLAARIERNGGTAGLLLMDLDRFKRINDTCGHLAGDAALRGVAEILRKTSRGGDGVYRYGGEEFLVLLHDCDEAALHMAGQRYLTAIQAAGMPHPDNPPYGVVTASAGATELSQANCTDVDSALHDSDEALYVAKEAGRNRLEIRFRPTPAHVIPIDQQRAAS